MTNIKEYDTINTVKNTVPRFNELVPSNQNLVYDMYVYTQTDLSCSTYRICKNDKYNTDKLPNVIPVSTFFNTTTRLPFVSPDPNPFYKKKHNISSIRKGSGGVCLQCIGREKYKNYNCSCDKKIPDSAKHYLVTTTRL